MYKDQIHIQGWENIHKKSKGSKYHIAHHDRGRGCRMYLCGCHRSIRIGDRYKYPGSITKQSNFQRRSHYNIGKYYK